jgi:tripartite-type tricarboxylate transporter receptor subunit TctC
MKNAGNRLNLIVLAMPLALASGTIHGEGSASGPGIFPSKAIRWIVPFPPGGPADVVARIVGQRLSERIGQPVIIDNRAGGSGSIGMEAAARAAPDGYTIFFGTLNEVINPILRKLTVDPMIDLRAVSQLTTVTFVLLANPDFPARTVPEVLAAARAKPGTVTCGWGASVFHLACELLKIQGQVDINIIPYTGAALSMKDLVGGQINLIFNATNTALPQVKANRAKAIATTNAKRGIGPFGDLPTVGETLSGFELSSWFGVLAPGATPAEIVARLNREIAAVLEQDDVRKRLADSGLEVAHGSPEAFAEAIRRDHAKFSKVIREAGLKPE